MKLQVLGGGCAKCEKLEELSRQTATELGIDFQIEKITDLNRILDFGVMLTPALVVNGEVVLSGRIPSRSELREILEESRDS